MCGSTFWQLISTDGNTAEPAGRGGGPMVVTIAREPDGWKVDLRWWLAMLDMSSAGPPQEESPDYAIRSLLLALLALKRDEASRFVAPGGHERAGASRSSHTPCISPVV